MNEISTTPHETELQSLCLDLKIVYQQLASKFDTCNQDVVPVARLEAFGALKLSKLESFSALKFSRLGTNTLKFAIFVQ